MESEKDVKRCLIWQSLKSGVLRGVWKEGRDYTENSIVVNERQYWTYRVLTIVCEKGGGNILEIG